MEKLKEDSAYSSGDFVNSRDALNSTHLTRCFFILVSLKQYVWRLNGAYFIKSGISLKSQIWSFIQVDDLNQAVA